MAAGFSHGGPGAQKDFAWWRVAPKVLGWRWTRRGGSIA